MWREVRWSTATTSYTDIVLTPGNLHTEDTVLSTGVRTTLNKQHSNTRSRGLEYV